MARIIDTDSPNYKALMRNMTSGQHNGAYYYSKEIVKNIIPNVKTDRPWDTLGVRGCGSMDRAIVFIHHNINPNKVYRWLGRYRDQVLVCSTPSTYEWARSTGRKAILLPLSVDIDYVSKFKAEKTKDACYAGNRWAFKDADLERYLPDDVDFPPKNIPRDELLEFIAPYKKCYAVGRCAIEAKILKCEIGICDSRYPNPSIWRIIDNKEAAEMLQDILNHIDGKENNAS